MRKLLDVIHCRPRKVFDFRCCHFPGLPANHSTAESELEDQRSRFGARSCGKVRLDSQLPDLRCGTDYLLPEEQKRHRLIFSRLLLLSGVERDLEFFYLI